MEKKAKLVYIIHGIAVGGAELAALSAFPSLLKHYHLQIYVLGKSNTTLLGGLEADVRETMIHFPYPAWLYPLYLPWVCWRLWRFKPDLVIASLWRSIMPALLYKLTQSKVRFMLLIHSTLFYHVLDSVFTKWGLRVADRVFADSASTKRFIQDVSGPDTNIQVLSFLITRTPEVLVPKGFSAGLRFFSISRLNPVKRMPLAVRVIATLRGAGLDASLDIYGRPDGDLEAVVNEIARYGLENLVTMRGELPPEKKSGIYSQYNCYIQMSAHEGMAMSVVEAMQQGMLCVLTPVGEIPYYAEDQVSAVFMEEANGQITMESLYKLVGILRDAEKCSVIATNAQRVFADKPNFAASLLQAIQKSQHHA